MLLHKREGYKVVVFEPAKSRIKNNQCPSCGLSKDLWTRRKDWRCCSVKCTTEYQKMYIAYGWKDLRFKALMRDKFICSHCGKEPEYVEERCWWQEGFEDFKNRLEKDFIVKSYSQESRLIGDRYRKFWFAKIPDASQLVGDHIIPISLGGAEFDINNVQTLCKPCNKIKTANDMKEIARFRKH